MSDTRKRYVTWTELFNRCRLLAEQIHENGEPVHLTAIARGGWVPARLIGGYLEAQGIRVSYSTIHVHSYDDSNQQKAVTITEPQIYEPPHSEQWWLIDDLVDSGNTVEALLTEIYRTPRLAVVFYKTESSVTPELYAEMTAADEWIVFPYETEARE